MDASLLESAKAAEESLRRREVEGLADGVPDDHPLKEAMRGQRLRAQDLAGLPDGHPLLVALKAAQERHELAEAHEEEQRRVAEVRKVKRIERREARARERRRESVNRRTAADAAAAVNKRLDQAMEAVKALAGALEEGMEPLMAIPEARVKVRRLERLTSAALSGLASSRVRVGRA